jgi:hypothetical protein
MPKQNRVTPFGDLIATAERGTLMGNRGCLHDERQQIRRRFTCRRWLICVLKFRGRHRTVMAAGCYTELFFLDEATALAAGHRPCAECQHGRYLLFRDHWARANVTRAGDVPTADQLDRALHAERLEPGGAKRIYTERLSRLPPGVMVADDQNRAFLLLDNALVPWSPDGYGPSVPGPADACVRVLTPRSVVRAIARGYPVDIHLTAGRDRH